MFTGLVSDVGTIRKAEARNGLVLFEVEGAYDAASIEIGASILHAGVCLTVVAKEEAGSGRDCLDGRSCARNAGQKRARHMGCWHAYQSRTLDEDW